MTERDLFEKGLAVRKDVLGADYVEKSIAGADEFTRTMAEWSDFERPFAAQALNSSWQVAVFGSATPSALAFSSAKARSFW